MSWTCRFLEHPLLGEDGRVDLAKLEVGDMYWYDIPEADWPRCHLTQHYWKHNTRRPPLAVMLPGRNWFLIDGQCYSGKRGYYDGWTVEGRAPAITVNPSIHIEGRYHGWLKNGVISDDVDGRRLKA